MHVYLIQNKVNGKCYVGQHVGDDLDWYFQENIKSSLRGNTGKRLLYRAIRKYSPENFDIRSISTFDTKEELDRYEIAYIKFFGTRNPELGYNLTDGGEGVLGFKMSDEQVEANRERAKIQYATDENHRKAFREGHLEYLKNRVFSDKHRKNLSESRKGIKFSEETLEKMAAAKIKTLCKNGHEKIGENALPIKWPNGKIYIRCRFCENEKSKKWQKDRRKKQNILIEE